jgi:D-cysteine desulfhydrase
LTAPGADLDRLTSPVPRARLATLPTPLQRLDRASADLGIELWCKRDDLTGVGLGGNKARPLEFLLGEALAADADVFLTGGGPASNYVATAAAAAAQCELDCHLVIYGGPPAAEPPNLALARRAGATVHFTGDTDRASVDARIATLASKFRAAGHRPYDVGRGGASPTGAIGYAAAVAELTEQTTTAGIEPRAIVVAHGSGGTHAGLVAGYALMGRATSIIGVAVSRPAPESRERLAALVEGCAARLGVDLPPTALHVELIDGRGEGYGRPSAAGEAAARWLAAREGLHLDPVFGAKAFAALQRLVGAQQVRGPVVFVHGGGAGGLLAPDLGHPAP